MAHPPENSTGSTEADLEAGIARAIRHALPWLRPDDVQHQLHFSIRLGHKTFNTDSVTTWRASGRADILLKRGKSPIAILELKRAGVKLTDQDRAQAISYARLLDPWPPLVITSNGEETHIFETFTGERWTPKTPTQSAFVALMKNTGRLANQCLVDAIGVLMGPDANMWVPLVKSITKQTLCESTGAWNDSHVPFVENFLIPRNSTAEVLKALRQGDEIVILLGAPLLGKSNVLRELAEAMQYGDEFVIFYLEAGSSPHGIFQTLANLFSTQLSWPAGPAEVRTWLRNISRKETGPCLVLAIDEANVQAINHELNELASDAYGPNLRMILALDRNSATSLTHLSNRRKKTRIGRLATTVEVGTLRDNEFLLAICLLEFHRIKVMRGAQKTIVYRTPWVLRSAAASALQSLEEGEGADSLVAISSFPGFWLIDYARRRFEDDDLLMGRYSDIAEVLLDDLSDTRKFTNREIDLVNTFYCRYHTLRSRLSDDELGTLMSDGCIKHKQLSGGERIIIAQIPELLAAQLATVLSNRFWTNLNESGEESALSKLTFHCENLPLGDIIGAKALVDLAAQGRGIPAAVLARLLGNRPRKEVLSPGQSKTILFPNVGLINVEVQEDDNIVAHYPDGRIFLVPKEESDLLMGNTLVTNSISWLILSYILCSPLEFTKVDEELLNMFEIDVLTELGSCPYILHQPSPLIVDDIAYHVIPGQGRVVCHAEGVVEPITLTLLHRFSLNQELGDRLISIANESNCYHLFSRILAAVNCLTSFQDYHVSKWARDVLDNQLKPKIVGTALDHE